MKTWLTAISLLLTAPVFGQVAGNVHDSTGNALQPSYVAGGATVEATATTSGMVNAAPPTSGTAIPKGNGVGGFSGASPSIVYAPATGATAILKGNGGGGGGSINAPPYPGAAAYYPTGSAAVSGISNEIHAGVGTLAAALASCPQVTWQASHQYDAQNAITDSNGNTQIITTAGVSGSGSHPAWATRIGASTVDGPTGTGVTGFWNMEMFHDVWVGMGPEAYGVRIVCSSWGGSNLVWNGGAIVDASTSSSVAMLAVDGESQGLCQGIMVNNPYFETYPGQGGDFLQLVGVANFTALALFFNGGPTINNCINISGSPGAFDQVHIDARSTGGMCRIVINNQVSGSIFKYTTNGAIKYDWESSGSQWIHQVGGIVNPFGPGGQGTYYSRAGTQLPACSAIYARYLECVSDASACTRGNIYNPAAGVGMAECQVQCNNAGNNWILNGTSCY